jgi:2-polyprenyl-6-methoxyphenol hydroxylase-like FAD-dependent oxidoreductase
MSIERTVDGRAVTAVFEDGSSASGSMIIGADGPNSIVRHLLLGDEKAATQPASTLDNPFTIVNAMIRYPKAEQAEFVRKLHPVFYMGLHPAGGLFMICSMPK